MSHITRIFPILRRTLFFFWWPAAFLVLDSAVMAQYRFDSWTTDNGLPQVSVNSIIQTRDGFLWFTTFGGLVRYDGLRFQVFNSGNTKGLKTGRFTQINEDREGILWISTEAQGLTRYKDGRFTTFSTETGLPDNRVTRIEENGDGRFLLATNDALLEWSGENFIPYKPPAGEPTRNILQRKADGSIWFLRDSRLRKFENGRITVDFEPKFTIHRMFEDSAGRVWIAGDRDELLMLRDGRLTSYSEKDGFPKCRFLNVFEDRRGRIFFATPLGLIIFDDGKFQHFTTDDGLIDNSVKFVYQDREGTVWVGTQGGLSRMTETLITPYSSKNGLAGDNVYAIFQDRRGKIWIGSWAGLSVYENGVLRDVSARFGLTTDNITAIYADRDETLWIGTWSGKIVRVTNEQVVTLPPNEQLGSHIRAIHQDRAGSMWFGTGNGLINEKNGSYTVYDTRHGLSGKTVFAIHEDGSGQFWIGTESGLTLLRDGVFTALTEKDGVSPNIVRSIYEDQSGVIWIGMYDSGLYRYADGKFTHFTTNEGLFDNGVFQIVEDRRGYFWISCNLGIYRVTKSELNEFAEGRTTKITSILYNKRDGMLNSECNGGSQPAGIIAQDGRIWFPTQKGVAVISPDLIPYNRQPPPVVIESVTIDTKPVDIYAPIRLRPGETNLEIHYSGLSFINPELVRFKYRLDGLDGDWTDAGSRRTAYYTHLPAGKYKFRVIAANRDGVWNPEGTTIEIEVLPPFWRQQWFIALVLTSVGLLAFAFYRWRTGTLKKAKAGQEAFSRMLIESQEEERKRIAVELHDSLGQSLVLIKNWAALGLKTANGNTGMRKNLSEISAAASEAINEVREIAYNLGPYQLDRLGLKTSIEEMLQKVASSSPITFAVEIDEIDGWFDKQTEINIFRILQEAVNNVVKHSAASRVDLSITIASAQLTMIVSDNGKGFTPDQINAKNKHGFGLIGISERVNLLKGEYSIRSEHGSGTTVVIQVPVEDKRNAT